MSSQEKNAYILGTDQEELHRLGLQHQVWSSEARQGWKLAEFSAGQTLLDLGCGPGYCSMEMAYLVGNEGKVIGVDKSKTYIEFLQQNGQLHGLNMDLRHSDFEHMNLKEESIDGAYSRWALAWLSDPEEIIGKVSMALRPGGVFVAQEYYNWSTFQTEPALPNLAAGIAAALKSFKSSDSEIDIGKTLPEMFYNCGLEVIHTRPMAKLATAEDLTWHWPKSFLKIYLPKVAAMGYLTEQQAADALEELEELEHIPGATIMCPLMVEVIGVKV